jgi:anti-sigma factor RsiW
VGPVDRIRRRLTCREVVELATGHLEGELGARLRRRFERHLAACAACSVYLAQMRAAVAGLRCLDRGDLPRHTRIQLAVLAARRRRRPVVTP